MIGKIDHVGIAVESIEEARGFYKALGLAIEAVEDVPAEGVRVAMIKVGESRIELIEATREDSPIAKFLAKRGPGLHHLCLATDDVRGDDAKLREAGVEVLRPEPTRGAGGCWVQFIHPRSAGGVLVELSEEPGGEVVADGSCTAGGFRRSRDGS
jgi:methylmalonyl-CoA/ethylmalonyl-CoA epimerase